MVAHCMVPPCTKRSGVCMRERTLALVQCLGEIQARYTIMWEIRILSIKQRQLTKKGGSWGAADAMW